MEYKAVYKCRLCGEVFAVTGTADKKTAQECTWALCLGIIHTDPLAPTMTDVHNCGGDHAGSLGLADFQGWEACRRRQPSDLDDHTESGLFEED